MSRFVDSQYLRSKGRDVAVPFRVRLDNNGRISELVCTQTLRVLPRKRLVCFGEWNGRQVVVKFFLDPTSGKRHYAREERGVSALEHAGIRTPALLFKCVIQPYSTPVLGFQRLMSARDLATAWEQAESTDRRKILLHQAAVVMAQQHEAGIKHNDPHLRNLLLADDKIFAIDGDAVDARKMGRPLSIAESLKNLGLFFAQFDLRFDGLVPEALESYAKKRKRQPGHDLTNRLHKNVRTQRNLRKKAYLKKIYRECSAFVCRKNWNRFMVCDRGLYDRDMVPLLDDPGSAMRKGRILKQGNTSTVSMVEMDGKRLVVKRYNIKNTRHALSRCLRPTRAWNSWRNAHRLRFLGITTPRPVAFVEKRLGPLRSTAYFITEYMDGIDAYSLLHSDSAKEINRESLVVGFGRMFQWLAAASISHGDFKATNFIVKGNQLFITDLDAMREHRSRRVFQRAFTRDLKRFMENWEDLPKLSSMFREELNRLKL